MQFSFHQRSCLPKVNIFFYKRYDHLREWNPVLVEFQNSYYQVLEMQLQLYSSQTAIKIISLFLLRAVQQYSATASNIETQKYTATASSTALFFGLSTNLPRANVFFI